MILDLITLSLLLAIFNTDVTAYGQFMISRPIVCAPLVGYLLGNLQAGLWIGCITEMLWISHIPMGTSIPFSITATTLLTTVWSIKYFNSQPAVCTAALAIALPLGVLFRLLDVRLRYFNAKIVRWIEQGIQKGDEKRISIGIFTGITLFFLKAFFFYLVIIYPGQLLLGLFLDSISPLIYSGLTISWYALLFVGFAVVLTNSSLAGNKCRK